MWSNSLSIVTDPSTSDNDTIYDNGVPINLDQTIDDDAMSVDLEPLLDHVERGFPMDAPQHALPEGSAFNEHFPSNLNPTPCKDKPREAVLCT